jgi:hypothetical protein
MIIDFWNAGVNPITLFGKDFVRSSNSFEDQKNLESNNNTPFIITDKTIQSDNAVLSFQINNYSFTNEAIQTIK